MPTYVDYGGWVISTIAGRVEVTADSNGDSLLSGRREPGKKILLSRL